jgi:hypothetical protein
MFPLKLQLKTVCVRFSNVIMLNIVTSQISIARFESGVPLFLKAIVLHVYIKIRIIDEGFCFMLVFRNLVLKVFVTQQIVILLPQASKAISRIYTYSDMDRWLKCGSLKRKTHNNPSGSSVVENSNSNPILFAICSSTFNKLCKQRIKQHVEGRSLGLLCK